MLASDKVRDILMMEFIGAQAKNPKFSMRAYSKKVGIPQSAISEIIGRKRKVTLKMATKILQGLALPPDKSADLINQFSFIGKNTQIKSDEFHSLSLDTFHLIAEWYHFAILSLAETKSFKNNEMWISRRLGISELQVKAAIARLLRLKMIVLDERSKQLKPTGLQYQIDPGVATVALKKACRENLELASVKLDSTNYEERDYTAITFCFDPARMAEAKRLIKHFRQKFTQQMETNSKKEVYKLSVQLFPLTKMEI